MSTGKKYTQLHSTLKAACLPNNSGHYEFHDSKTCTQHSATSNLFQAKKKLPSSPWKGLMTSRICFALLFPQKAVRIKQNSLAAVLFGAREGLGVDMSQGDVLIPLQVSHQNSDFWLHQTDPEGKTSVCIHRGAGNNLSSLPLVKNTFRNTKQKVRYAAIRWLSSNALTQKKFSLNTMKAESGFVWFQLTDQKKI